LLRPTTKTDTPPSDLDMPLRRTPVLKKEEPSATSASLSTSLPESRKERVQRSEKRRVQPKADTSRGAKKAASSSKDAFERLETRYAKPDKGAKEIIQAKAASGSENIFRRLEARYSQYVQSGKGASLSQTGGGLGDIIQRLEARYGQAAAPDSGMGAEADFEAIIQRMQASPEGGGGLGGVWPPTSSGGASPRYQSLDMILRRPAGKPAETGVIQRQIDSEMPVEKKETSAIGAPDLPLTQADVAD